MRPRSSTAVSARSQPASIAVEDEIAELAADGLQGERILRAFPCRPAEPLSQIGVAEGAGQGGDISFDLVMSDKS